MATFFTSDQHFGHRNIIQYCNRPFGSLEQMHEALIRSWNEVVSVDDDVYVLGDFAFCNPNRVLPQLKGNLFLVRGNHDGKAVCKNARWGFVKDYHEMSVDGKKLVLCHYPLLTWNGAHRGSWMLHGHSHGSLGEEHSTRTDVGVDTSGFVPLSWDQIKLRLGNREYKVVDGHKHYLPTNPQHERIVDRLVAQRRAEAKTTPL